MQNLTKLSKILLSIVILFYSLWLGGYVLRQTVVYQLFDSRTLALKSIYNPQNLHEVLITILPVFVFNLISYSGLILFLILFLFIAGVKLKNEGWLFISVLIILICAPFEIYLSVLDYNIIQIIYSQNFNYSYAIDKIFLRLTVLSSFSLIEILSFLGIIFLVVFKPLRKALK